MRLLNISNLLNEPSIGTLAGVLRKVIYDKCDQIYIKSHSRVKEAKLARPLPV